MPYFDKHFTLEEANQLIPRVKEIFAGIHALIHAGQHVKKVIPLFPSSPSVSNGKHNGSLNGNGKPHKPKTQQEVLYEINTLLAELTDAGIVIQDVHRGLIDFPGYVDGEEVFLCYELSDGDRIRFWHHLNSGYAGRTLLNDEP